MSARLRNGSVASLHHALLRALDSGRCYHTSLAQGSQENVADSEESHVFIFTLEEKTYYKQLDKTELIGVYDSIEAALAHAGAAKTQLGTFDSALSSEFNISYEDDRDCADNRGKDYDDWDKEPGVLYLPGQGPPKRQIVVQLGSIYFTYGKNVTTRLGYAACC